MPENQFIQQIVGELLATGSSANPFSIIERVSLEKEAISPKSTFISTVVSSNIVILTDDSDGGFVDGNGDPVAGSIDYSTGIITDLDFGGNVDDLEPVIIDYSFFNTRSKEVMVSWLSEEVFTEEGAQRIIEGLSEELRDMHVDISQLPVLRSLTQVPAPFLSDLEFQLGLKPQEDFEEETRRRRLLTVTDFIRIKGTEDSVNFFFFFFNIRFEIVDLFSTDYIFFVKLEDATSDIHFATPHFLLRIDLGETGFIIDEEFDYGPIDIPAESLSVQGLLGEIGNVKPAETVLEEIDLLRRLTDIFDDLQDPLFIIATIDLLDQFIPNIDCFPSPNVTSG